MIRAGERYGEQGWYLDGPFFPRFFPNTPEGQSALSRQIDADIRATMLLLVALGGFVIIAVLAFAAAA